jgi:basic membrane protein A
MRVKAAASFILAFALAGLASCDKSAKKPDSSDGTAEAFRVAIILPRSIDTDEWTKAGYDGLMLIRKALGAETSYRENVPDADFEKAYEDYAAQGFDFIIGHGGQFIPAAEKAAARFPRTSFAVVALYGGNNTNLGGISMREGEMGYLLGVVAATKTRTKRVAFLGGAQNPSNKEITDSFRRGVLAADPSIRLRVDWVGDFTDSARAEALAREQISAGVDVILVLAGQAGDEVHSLAEKAGVFTLGWISDMSRLAPKAVVTSNVQDVPEMLLRGATLAKLGRWEGKQYRFGMAEGVQGLAPFNGLLSKQEELRIDSARNDILSGKLDTAR